SPGSVRRGGDAARRSGDRAGAGGLATGAGVRDAVGPPRGLVSHEEPMSNPVVRIEIPASGEYLAVLRAAATGLAASLHFTYEQIDDLRIAVDEACAQLLARHGGADLLRVAYVIAGSTLQVQVTVTGDGPAESKPLPKDTFSWQILKALTDEVDEHVDGVGVHLSFSKRGGTR